jgi:class 3 adenylate cyclase
MSSLVVFGQQNKIDSLKMMVENGKKDSIMTSNLLKLSSALLNKDDLDGSILYAKEAVELANDLNDLKSKAYAYKNIGLAEFYQSNYFETLENWNQSLAIFRTTKNSLGIANMTSNLGVVFYSQGSHEKALDYYFESLEVSEKLKDPLRITTSLANIGGVYSQIPDYDKSLEYFKKIEPYLSDLENPGIRSAYLLGVGENYSHRGNHREAIEFYNQALDINKDSPDHAHNLTLLGKEYHKLGNIEKATSYLELALAKAIEYDMPLDEVQTLLELGNVNQKNNTKKALENYQKGESLAKEIETNEELRDIYKGMSLTYQGIGDFKNAYLYQDKFLELKDQIFNSEILERSNLIAADYDLNKKQDQIGLLEKEAEILELNERRQIIVKYISFVIAGLILLLALGLYRRNKFIQKTKQIIEEEKNRSDKLLLNILPEETAMELKENGKVQAKQFNSVTVLFTDFKGFTQYSENLSPEALVETIGFYFSKFDEIVKSYGLEKIKTIGDAYMCAGGLPFPTVDHANKMIMAAFEIADFVDQTKKNEEAAEKIFDIRIGINTGPVVAGVVGSTKFAYDIWGDTVNVASRMESKSEPGRINISENTYNLVKENFDCEYRGEIEAKNRGKLKMYFVNKFKEKDVPKSLAKHKMNV